MRLDQYGLKHAIIHDIAELKVQGYSQKLIERIWPAQRCPGDDKDIAFKLPTTTLYKASSNTISNHLSQVAEAVAQVGRYHC